MPNAKAIEMITSIKITRRATTPAFLPLARLRSPGLFNDNMAA